MMLARFFKYLFPEKKKEDIADIVCYIFHYNGLLLQQIFLQK